jgi:hypothetical protein
MPLAVYETRTVGPTEIVAAGIGRDLLVWSFTSTVCKQRTADRSLVGGFACDFNRSMQHPKL